MAKSKDSKNNTEFKDSEHIKRNLPDEKNSDMEIPHNVSKEGLGQNTKR